MSWQNIYQASIALLASFSEKKTYEQIAKQAQVLIEGNHASIFLYNNGYMARVYTTTPQLRHVYPRKNGITIHTYKNGMPYVRSSKELEKISPIFKKLGVNMDFMIPLIYENKVFGVLSVLSSKKESSAKKNLTLLKRFMPMAALAIREMQHRERLKKALKQRDLFIALASHELKTPMTSVSLYAQTLASNKKSDKNTEEIVKKKLVRTVEQLKYLTNDLLQTNMLRQGTFSFIMKDIDLKEIVESAVTEFKDVYGIDGIQVVNQIAKEKAIIVGDKEKFIQTIINLLSNATKYSKDKPSITVTLTENRTQFFIKVIDNGIGISSKDLPRIFDQFYQGAALNKQGFGLGLYLIKNIIKKHHGSIQVNSTVGKGTTVSIKLPKKS